VSVTPEQIGDLTKKTDIHQITEKLDAVVGAVRKKAAISSGDG
jgi:hypothetical protein